MTSHQMNQWRQSPARHVGHHIAPGLRAELPPRAERAFVTLLSDPDDLPGAEALLRSLRLSGTGADLAVMHRQIPDAGLARLRVLGARLIQADPLPTSDAFNRAHTRDAPHRHNCSGRRATPDAHNPLDRFLKLRVWQLDYARCVFIEADAIVLRPVDKLFDFPEFCAAPDLCAGLDGFHRMNAGVFTARPDAQSFRSMICRLDRPGQVWRRSDHSFLQDYFPDWLGLPVQYTMLQDVWINLPQLWDWSDLHILRYHGAKPWHRHARAAQLAPLIALWQQIANGGPMPDLSVQQRPVAWQD